MTLINSPFNTKKQARRIMFSQRLNILLDMHNYPECPRQRRKQLAKVINVSYRRARQYLNGQVMPHSDKISRISDDFNVEYQWLSEGTGNMERIRMHRNG